VSAPLVISASLLGVAAAVSALQKWRRDPTTLAALHAVGVRDTQIALLAIPEALGAVGLLVGTWVAPLGLAAAVGLALFYGAAIGAHLRVRNPFRESVPALVLLGVAVVTVAFELAR
jgi:hypothetical protein